MRFEHALRTATSAAATLAVIVASSHAMATTRTYPGAAPCDTTLQACADGAGAGDTIQIASNGVIAEFVTTDKTLTFEPAAGFTPTVEGIFAVATTVDVALTVQNLALNGVRVVLAPGGGNLTLTARNNVIDSSSFDDAINASAGTGAPGPYGTLTVVAQDNVISQSGGPGNCASGIGISGVPARFVATVTGNRITLDNLYQCGGIDAVIGGTSATVSTATIDRNEIRGTAFDFGIEVRNFGTNPGETPGTLDATVTDNLVAGQDGNTGAPAGLVVSADGNNAAIAASLVNNTIVDGRIGVLVSLRDDLGAVVTGGLFNNIVAFNSQTGIGIDGAAPGFANGYNVDFGNGGDFFTPGAGTLLVNPLFVNRGSGNYQLSPASPAIDHGLDAALAPAFAQDLAGGPRRVGTIDIGAYESGFSVVPALPRSALAVLAALLAGMAGWRLRRRH